MVSLRLVPEYTNEARKLPGMKARLRRASLLGATWGQPAVKKSGLIVIDIAIAVSMTLIQTEHSRALPVRRTHAMARGGRMVDLIVKIIRG